MGRGRAKAKQTKVARELKYSDGGTDLDALRRELISGSPSGGVGSAAGTRSDGVSGSSAVSGTDNADTDDLDDDEGRLGRADFG